MRIGKQSKGSAGHVSERRRELAFLALGAVALGAAAATRANTLVALPVVLALIVWRGRQHLRRALVVAAGMTVIAVAVVWVVYLAVDPRLRWTAPAGMPDTHGIKALVANVLPFPRSFRDGVRIQFGLDAEGARTFLFGRVYSGRVWFYLPAAMLVKTPLGTLIVWVAAVGTLVSVRRWRSVVLYLLVPPAVLLAVVSAGNRDYGTRYAIFVPMFGAVAAATLVALKWRWAHVVTAVLVVFTAVSSARAFPFYLPYSNEAFGGPSKTYLRLHDSNVDWGQDLGRLADRLRTRYPGERTWLVYKGSGVPAYYGISADDPLRAKPDQVRGLLIVSDSAIDLAGGPLKALIASSRPVDQVGHSITIFRR